MTPTQFAAAARRCCATAPPRYAPSCSKSAALIEHAPNPDPACVAALRNLLANGCDSPLYNADMHISELHATLHYVRSGL